MRWTSVDLNRRVWSLAATETKNGVAQQVPLSEWMMVILQQLPRQSDVFVFPSTTLRTPISGFSKSKKRLDELTGVRGWRLHDLRRTAATYMAEAGVSSDVLSLVLNHRKRSQGVQEVYDRFVPMKPQIDALSRWCSELRRLSRTDERSDEHASDDSTSAPSSPNSLHASLPV